MIVATGLILGAVAAIMTVDTTEDPQGPTVTTPSEESSCTSTDRRSIVSALRDGYSSDVATRVRNLRCSDTFAYGTVCILCGPPQPGAIFGVLLAKGDDGTWRYLGSGGPTVVEELADNAGLSRSDLDQLRGSSPR